MSCKNICKQPYYIKEFDIKGLYGKASFRRGFKKCTVCEISLKNTGRFCPCCNKFLRTNQRHKSRQSNPMTVLKKLIKQHDTIVVVGSAGVGKTVLANQLGADAVFDDLDLHTYKSDGLLLQSIQSQVMNTRHHEKKAVLCVQRKIPDFAVQQNTAYFFIGLSPYLVDDYDFINRNLLLKQADRFKRSIQNRRKQRPYLFVSKNTHHFGWFKYMGGIFN